MQVGVARTKSRAGTQGISEGESPIGTCMLLGAGKHSLIKDALRRGDDTIAARDVHIVSRVVL